MLHIEVLTHKSDVIKQISPVFSDSELFENFPIGLALRGHDLPLTSGQQYKNTGEMLYNSANQVHPESLKEIGQTLCGTGA